jgi:hypothetical protein
METAPLLRHRQQLGMHRSEGAGRGTSHLVAMGTTVYVKRKNILWNILSNDVRVPIRYYEILKIRCYAPFAVSHLNDIIASHFHLFRPLLSNGDLYLHNTPFEHERRSNRMEATVGS